MPFGEQINPDTTYRTANLKYNYGDNIRQKFTGYLRDEETGLDFAEARYYNDAHGRFTAVDPLLASGKSANPQTFNRYAYTMNCPLILTDSTGLRAGSSGSSGREASFAIEHPVAASEIGQRATTYGKDIASVATRYAVNSTFNGARGLQEPTEINALRHTILSAIITVRYGAEIAQQVTDSHESNNTLPSSETGSTVFKDENTADKEADLRNNETGREIGSSLSPSASRKDVAVAVLKHFKNVGLVVYKKNADGTVEVITTKISDEKYNSTLNEWNKRDDDAFTPAGRAEANKREEEEKKKKFDQNYKKAGGKY